MTTNWRWRGKIQVESTVEFKKRVCSVYTIYIFTIYIFLCKPSAGPNPFRGTHWLTLRKTLSNRNYFPDFRHWIQKHLLLVLWKAFAQLIVFRGINIDSEDKKSVHWAYSFYELHCTFYLDFPPSSSVSGHVHYRYCTLFGLRKGMELSRTGFMYPEPDPSIDPCKRNHEFINILFVIF